MERLNNIQYLNEKEGCRAKKIGYRLFRAMILPLIILVSSALISNGQVNITGDYKVYISGQVTNIENGAPVPGQVIYIESDQQYNPSFSFSDSVTTDIMGF